MNSTALIAQLEDADEAVRIAAALTLGLRCAAAAVPALLELLRSDNAIDRRVAARALGRIRSGAAIPALRQAATADADGTVRKLAAEALAAGGRAA